MRIYLDSVGCRLNQSEIEKFAAQFRAAGHILVDAAGEADIVLINTCTVTVEAASDSRQKIRQASRAGKADIVVTGCWSTLEAGAAAALPGVKWVIPNVHKKDLVTDVLNLPVEKMDLEPLARQPLPGIHKRTRAFIKTQDGCDNHCTFCVTRIARGAGRSQSMEEVLADIHLALAGGTKEIVLTGVHLGSWGQDFDPPQHLKDLVNTILLKSQPRRMRLSSLEPWDLSSDFFALWQDKRMCHHLHLPLQSGCGATLRRMARKVTPESFAGLVETARRVSPEMAITTDVIVGFPGETDAEFGESLNFVRQMAFAGGHVFSYSARPGTPAARYPNQVPSKVYKERSAALRAVLAESARTFKQRFVGQKFEVLWEGAGSFGPQGWQMEGLTDNYLRVVAWSPENRWNEVNLVELKEDRGDGLSGIII
ncbi:MAG TPA: MiaB/RimO family radical SAM methylthiotransferase [Anaerolineaceae bacterium]